MEAHARTHRHTHTPRAGMTLRLEAKFNKAPPESGMKTEAERGGCLDNKVEKENKAGEEAPSGRQRQADAERQAHVRAHRRTAGERAQEGGVGGRNLIESL